MKTLKQRKEILIYKSFKAAALLLLFYSLIMLLPYSAYTQESVIFHSLLYPSLHAVDAGKKESFTHEEFIFYALLFSGVEEDKIDYYIEKYRGWAEALNKKLSENPELYKDIHERGNAVLVFLHENLLKQYNERVTEIDILLDRGIFNCVSSGIMYYALGLMAGIDVFGVRTADHAFCAVLIDGKTVDVETTNIYGFNPGEQKEFKTAFGETGFVYTPPSNYSSRLNINQKEYLALVLQNRISEMQSRGNYTDTVQPAADRHAVLSDNTSFTELMGEFKNYAALLNSRREYEKAFLFLEKAADIYDSAMHLSETAGKIFYNQIAAFLEKNSTNTAYDFHYRHRLSSLLSSEMLTTTDLMIKEKQVYLDIMNSSFSKSLETADKGRDNRFIDDKTYKEYLVYIYSREIQRASVDEGWIEAFAAAGRALAATENDSRIKKLYNAAEQNISVIYHNEFVKFYNSGNMEKALEILYKGLELLPGNKRLLDNLNFYNSRSSGSTGSTGS